jgi:hypothetical protein
MTPALPCREERHEALEQRAGLGAVVAVVLPAALVFERGPQVCGSGRLKRQRAVSDACTLGIEDVLLVAVERLRDLWDRRLAIELRQRSRLMVDSHALVSWSTRSDSSCRLRGGRTAQPRSRK